MFVKKNSEKNLGIKELLKKIKNKCLKQETSEKN